MANIKVSELAETTNFNPTDYTMIIQSNQNKKISKSNMLKDLYSTEETKTNKLWINNKPIYRKVIQAQNALEETIEIPLNNISSQIDLFTSISGILLVAGAMENSEPLFALPIPYYNNTDKCIISYDNSQKKIIISLGSGMVYSLLYIIFEYTKTTD